jgi:hypothetical protein
MIPRAPKLPLKYERRIHRLRKDLETDGLVRGLPRKKAKAWDAVIEQWIASNLPLFVRRSGHPKMCMKISRRGKNRRCLVPADNSPAHWIVMQCFKNVTPSLSYVRKNLYKIPMKQRMSAAIARRCHFPRRLDEFKHPGSSGWYVAHIKAVGLGKVKGGDIRYAPIQDLEDHFRKFMKPSNMLLVATRVSGLSHLAPFMR